MNCLVFVVINMYINYNELLDDKITTYDKEFAESNAENYLNDECQEQH